MSAPLTGKYAGIFYGGEAWELCGYGSRLAARHGIVTHAINHGWTLEDCRQALLNDLYPGSELWTTGEDGRRLSAAESEKRVRRDYRDCAAYVAEHPAYRHAQEVRQEMSLLIARVNERPWPGRTGRIDHDVLVGAMERAAEVGSDQINLSVREAMLRAGLGRPETASKSLRRLVGDGWLELTRAAGRGEREASEYKVTVAARLTRPDGAGARESDEEGQRTKASHEAWLHHLGKAAKAIYESLTTEPQSVTEIARKAGVSKSTASENLNKKLAKAQMAVKRDGGWVIGPVTPDDLVYANDWLGDNSKTRQRQERVRLDREAQKMWRDGVPEELPEIDTPALAESRP